MVLKFLISVNTRIPIVCCLFPHTTLFVSFVLFCFDRHDVLKTIVQWKIKTYSLDLVDPNDPVLKDIAKEFNIVFKKPVRVLRGKAIWIGEGGRVTTEIKQ